MKSHLLSSATKDDSKLKLEEIGQLKRQYNWVVIASITIIINNYRFFEYEKNWTTLNTISEHRPFVID